MDVLTANSCVPINGFEIARIAEFGHAPCAAQIEEVNRRMEQAVAVILAGKWVYHMPSEAFIDAMTGFSSTLQKHEKPLLVLAQIPMIEGDIRRARRFARLGLSHELIRSSDWQKSNSEIAALTENYDIATFLDLSGPFWTFLDLSGVDLFENVASYAGEIIHFDSHHINETGSRFYGLAAVAAVAYWLKDAELLPWRSLCHIWCQEKILGFKVEIWESCSLQY